MSMEQKDCFESWTWDYFSIRDDAICMSVCDICGKEERHLIYIEFDMKIHLYTKHTATYNKIRNASVIHWESYFERVQCSTDAQLTKNGYIKCKHCDEYNDILLQVSEVNTMVSHLKEEHNVTKNDWEYLQNWRDENTENYYDLTREYTESIKRTRLCKKCGHHFRRSNLIIMIKHLMQSHSFVPYINLNKLPKGLLRLNYPAVDASNSQEPSTSGKSDSSLPKPAGPDLNVWRPWGNEDP